MTHAALQDLVKKWRDDADTIATRANEKDPGGGYRWAEWHRGEMNADAGRLRRCADELSAALSAMEGEAVAWQYRVKNEDTGYVQPWSHWDRGDRPEMIGRWKAEYRPLYTAPPPQQAEKK